MANVSTSDNPPAELDQTDRIVEGVALSVLLFISLILNVVVIGIVLKNRTLRSKPANIFVANLCVSNLVMMVFVVPFSLTTVFVNRHEAYSKTACQVNGFFSVASSVCIVLTLCCISLDRYIAVTRSTRYKTIITTRRVGYALVIVWVQGLLYASLPLFGWSEYKYHSATLHCSPNLANECGLYFFLAFVGFLTPIVIMIITYLRIFITIRKHSRKVSTRRRPISSGKTAAVLSGTVPLDTSPNSPNNPEVKLGTTPDTALREPISDSGGDFSLRPAVSQDGYASFAPTEPSRSEETTSFQQNSIADVAITTTAAAVAVEATARRGKRTKRLSIEIDSSRMRTAPNEPASTSGQRSKPKPHRVAMALRRMQSRKRAKPSTEVKVAKTGLLLLVIFLVLWMPYMVVHSCFRGFAVHRVVFRLAMWLVYMNGIANPVVYALMNSNVKQKFKVLVSNLGAACCCRRRGTKHNKKHLAGDMKPCPQ